ncbi:hypothetical protein GCM10022253_08860 [Sphingomonas endophytica]|jgi:hypothetical protein|uniref:Uncharacterized protein n=1 Tax=Sphingomonas endophytica TaxID=869719 RepID=A0A7X0MLQ0_9SPHN|nr:hypothetical protein [Sphingomonas endophytica]MBB5724578.1 hypothetical protein [Sphingomonas endophytica]MBB6503464.1 hypothetical protein [Sphingomonas endophytica]
MFEGVLLCALAFVLLAAASYKFRREAGISGERAVRALRSGAALLIALALVRVGTPMDGERWVRLLTCASIAAVAVVLALSIAPGAVFYPVRRVLRRS